MTWFKIAQLSEPRIPADENAKAHVPGTGVRRNKMLEISCFQVFGSHTPSGVFYMWGQIWLPPCSPTCGSNSWLARPGAATISSHTLGLTSNTVQLPHHSHGSHSYSGCIVENVSFPFLTRNQSLLWVHPWTHMDSREPSSHTRVCLPPEAPHLKPPPMKTPLSFECVLCHCEVSLFM